MNSIISAAKFQVHTRYSLIEKHLQIKRKYFAPLSSLYSAKLLNTQYIGTRTTDAQRGNSLHWTAKNTISIPNFHVRPKHISSATSTKFYRYLWFMPSLGVRSPCVGIWKIQPYQDAMNLTLPAQNGICVYN